MADKEFFFAKKTAGGAGASPAVDNTNLRESLNIQCMKIGEKIFRQMKQNSARVVHPTRRDFVKYHGKDSADFLCDEFLEIPLIFPPSITQIW